MAFTWYFVSNGAAYPVRDSAEISAAIDNGATGYFGTIEGAIIHGGVQATAFKRKVEPTYNAEVWLRTGQRVSAGHVVITEVTAAPDWNAATADYRRISSRRF